MKPTNVPDALLSRRQLLVAATVTAGGLTVGACTGRRATRARVVEPSAGAVGQAEARRRRAGAPVREVTLSAAPVTIDLAGRTVTTWAYNDAVPGPVVRLRAGEVLRARLDNRLGEPTTIHWHGVALRNDMDGAAGMTQPPVGPGGRFTYEFTVPDPGTYWFHPHVGLQLDRGLYGPLLVDDPAEPGRYDHEQVVVLDDWTDGVGPSPEQLQARLAAQGGMMMGQGGMDMMGQSGGNTSPVLGGSGGQIDYPLYLLNGRPPADPPTIRGRPGQRLRLRVVNAAAETAFRLALGGHRLTVTHSDGLPVVPVTVDALVLGMGERYDAVITLGDGAFPLVALAEGKRGHALGVVRTGAGAPPTTAARPGELDGRLLALGELRADPRVALGARQPDRTHQVVLSGGMMDARWTINGRTFDDQVPLQVRQGERVRLVLANQSMMFHPVHLHGHSFQVRAQAGMGPRKDTVIVRPMEQLAVDLAAANPGQWMLHCHNLYHQQAGMMSTLSYVS
jgi:FtsP/CotA-like multicopper oxidase with cupredoxin domain